MLSSYNMHKANSPYNYIHYKKNSQPTIASWLTKLLYFLKTVQKVPDTRRGDKPRPMWSQA